LSHFQNSDALIKIHTSLREKKILNYKTANVGCVVREERQ